MGRTFALPLMLSYSLESTTAFATLIKMWIFGEFGLSHTVYNLSTTFTYKSVFRFDSLNINADFLMPVFFSDSVEIETATVQWGNKSFTLLQRATVKGTNEVKCECRTTLVMYDLLTKEPTPIPEHYKNAICQYEGKTLEELAKK